MKKVLIIAYYFPPLGGGGVQRPLQWVRYLPENGWLPTVLTVEEGYWSSRDEEGLRRIPPEVRVIRTPYLSAVTLRNRLLKTSPPPER
ncbi:MAG: glycosyl transferase family 1, partial [Bdellovibrionota bacterium]